MGMKKTILTFAAVAVLVFAATCATFAFASGAPSAVSELPIKQLGSRQCYCYTVKSGDTVYGVAHRLGLTREQIVNFNPSAADGLKAGQQLYFPVDFFAGDKHQDQTGALQKQRIHIVQKDETVFGIARQYGITVDSLIAMNPAAERNICPGMQLTVAKHCGSVESEGDSEAVPVTPDDGRATTMPVHPERQVVTPGNDGEGNCGRAQNSTAAVDADTAGVVLFLPFMLNEEKPGKTAQQVTEFYRGFLQGLTEAPAGSRPLKVSVFDTENSDEAINRILASEKNIENAAMIIAPDNKSHLAILGRYGQQHGVKVLNSVTVRDSTYLTNPWVMQGSIPTDQMYRLAIQDFVVRYDGLTPVILVNENGRNDKQPFVDMLTETLLAKGIHPLTVTYNGSLLAEDISAQLGEEAASQQFVFIPRSGALTEYNKFATALEKHASAIAPAGGSLTVYGYPEWVTFLGDAKTSLRTLGATIYSRSFADENSAGLTVFNDTFGELYGRQPSAGVPSQALLGHDTARYVLQALSSNDFGIPVRGLQSTYRLVQTPQAAGLVNQSLYIIAFRPDGQDEITIL